MNSYTISKETSNIISLISKAIKCAKDSKANNVKGVKEYGAYLNVLACDIDLICDAIIESKKCDLVNVLEEMIIWYRKTDLAAQIKN